MGCAVLVGSCACLRLCAVASKHRAGAAAAGNQRLLLARCLCSRPTGALLCHPDWRRRRPGELHHQAVFSVQIVCEQSNRVKGASNAW